MLTGITPHTAVPWLLVSYLVFGIGFGVVNAPITNTAVSGHATGAGRRCRRDCVDVPSGRPVARRRGHRSHRDGRHSRIAALLARRGEPSGLVDRDRVRLAIVIFGLLTTSQWANETAIRTADTMAAREPAPSPVPV